MSNDQLLKNFSKYKNPELARKDVQTALQHYRDLRPSLEPYVFNDGTTQNLVQLEGTIPVQYKGNTYNIPVQFWILDTHPHNPPMVYVRPTSTMQIRSGRYVDTNGKVDMPYLREWRWPKSDLMGLLEILRVTFGDECPVFSKVQSTSRPSLPNASQPPYPTNSAPMMMPSLGGQGPNPSFTPYPSSGYPQQGYPPYPPQQSGSFPTVNSFGFPPGGGYPPSSSGYPPQQPLQYPFSGYGNNPPYPPPATSFAGTQGTAVPSAMGTVTEEHLRASLLSAVEDKMKRKLREIFAQAQAEMDVLKKTEADLTKGKEKLEQMLKDLEQEKASVESSIILLTNKDREVKEALQKMQNSDKVDVDEAVITTTPLYRQLLDAFAEEQAIEDAVYYLGEALRKNVIELEVFMKRVRELSRKQFMLRALIQKCREKAGLPPLV